MSRAVVGRRQSQEALEVREGAVKQFKTVRARLVVVVVLLAMLLPSKSVFAQ